MPIRVGIAGYGYAGEVIHAPLVAATEGLELVAVSTGRSDRAEIARARGLRVHVDAASLIEAGDIDLVVVATPHDTHRSLVLEACRARKHVVCDKLMALSAEEASDMIEAAERAGVMLSVFHNRRWDGDFLMVRDALHGRPDIGRLVRIRSWVHSAPPPSGDRWRGSLARGGGIFSDWGAHLVDQALELHDVPVRSVTCQMLHAFPAVDVETSALCVLEFEDGTGHVIETNQGYHASAKGYDVWGTGARLEIRGFDPRENMLNRAVRGVDRRTPGYEATLFSPDAPDGVRIEPPSPGDWGLYYRNVADHVRGHAPLAVTPQSVLRMMRLRDAALRSARLGETVNGPI